MSNSIRMSLWNVGICVVAIVLLLVLAALVLNPWGPGDGVIHLLGGFYFFLSERLPAITSDAGTWGPGLAAWVVALAVGHRLLRKWAVAKGLYWRVSTTVCVGLLLPVMFATAFIVPGIVMQVDGLRKEERWFEEHGASIRVGVVMDLRNLAQGCAGFANVANDEKYPESIDALVKKEFLSASSMGFSWVDNTPPEFPIYLGAGYTRDTPMDAPLAISPRYPMNGSWERTVVSVGGKMTTIRDDEVDAWIDRVIPR